MRYLQGWAGVLLLAAGIIASLSWNALNERSHRLTDRAYGLDATVTTTPDALLVDSMREGGDAERAGLRIGDRIEKLDQRDVRSRSRIDRALIAHHRVRLHVRRGARTLVVDVATQRT